MCRHRHGDAPGRARAERLTGPAGSTVLIRPAGPVRLTALTGRRGPSAQDGNQVGPRRRCARRSRPARPPASTRPPRRKVGSTGSRPPQPFFREEQQRHQRAEREPPDVGPVRDAARAHVAERPHAAEELKHEPHPEDDGRGEGDEGDDEEEDQRQHLPAREHDEVRAEHTGDRSRRAEVRHDAVRPHGDLGGTRHDPGHQIEQGIAEAPQPVLDVVAEDPEEPHVAENVQPPRVEEHRGEDRQDPALVPAARRKVALELRGQLRVL